MLENSIKLTWGKYPELVFETLYDFFQGLGQLTNSSICNISYEENSKTGSYTDVYRVKFLINKNQLIRTFQKKITTGNRLNCHELIAFLVKENIFSYNLTNKKVERNYQEVINAIEKYNPEYISIFNQGYFETNYSLNIKETQITTEELFTINNDYIANCKNRVLVKKDLPKECIDYKATPLQRKRKSDFIKKSIRNSEIGLLGESYVYKNEYAKLKKAEIEGKIESVEECLKWISKTDDSAGYDIQTFDLVTKEKIFIEVKTTTEKENTPFFISGNELSFSENNKKNYKLIRIYNFRRESNEDIEYFEINGNIKEYTYLLITPTNFEVSFK